MPYNPNNNPYVPGDPYSYDLKWIVNQVKTLIANYDGLEENLKAYIDTYLENLDLTPEIAAQVQEAIDNGAFDDVFNEFVTDNKVVLANTDQSNIFTAAEKAIARKNIQAASSNRNLIDNSWFTINQRGVTSGNFSVGAKIDRWRTSYATDPDSTWTLNNGVLTITTTTSRSYFLQRFDDPSIFTGHMLTASLLLDNDSIVNGSAVKSSLQANFITNSAYSVYMTANGEFTIAVEAGNTLAIKAVKLELGNTSTLSNDIQPDYAEELAKCQQYCRVLTAGTANANVALAYVTSSTTSQIAFPWAMRTITGVSFTGTWNIAFSGQNYPISAINPVPGGQTSQTVTVTMTHSSTGGTGLARFNSTAGSTIIFSADL